MSYTKEHELNIWEPLRRTPLAMAAIAVAACLASCAAPEDSTFTERTEAPHPDISTNVENTAKSSSQIKQVEANKNQEDGFARATNSQKKQIGVAVSPRFFQFPGYLDLIKDYDVIVPENEAKMDTVIAAQPTLLPSGDVQLSYNFEGIEKIMEVAKANKQAVRGHTFIFGGQDPLWIRKLAPACPEYDPQHPAAQKLDRLKQKNRALLSTTMLKYISEFSARYPGKINEWDVVNEPVADVIQEPVNDQIQLEQNSWGKCSPDNNKQAYIDLAFQIARNKNPNAKLFLNEIGAEFQSPRQDVLFNLAKSLKTRGIPLTGVGFQGHFAVEDWARIGELDRTLDRFAKLGLEVKFTELDVSLSPNPTPKDYIRQKLVFDGAARACVKQSACSGVIFWGASDAYSWRSTARPTLVDAQGRPKAAYYSVRKILNNR